LPQKKRPGCVSLDGVLGFRSKNLLNVVANFNL
jgi:hypothetical protein